MVTLIQLLNLSWMMRYDNTTAILKQNATWPFVSLQIIPPFMDMSTCRCIGRTW